MKLGLCKCCGTSLGRRTANGFFFYDKNKKQQILMRYEWPLSDDRTASTEWVVMLCKECAAQDPLDVDSIEKSLSAEAGFKTFLKNTPGAKYASFCLDPLDVN